MVHKRQIIDQKIIGDVVTATVSRIKEIEEETRLREKVAQKQKVSILRKIDMQKIDKNDPVNKILELFKERFFYDEIYVAEYLVHREPQRGHLLRLKDDVKFLEDQRFDLDMGIIDTWATANGVEVTFLGQKIRTSIIRTEKGNFIEFGTNLQDLLGLGSVMALYIEGGEEVLNEILLRNLDNIFSINVGNIDIAGYDDVIKKCMNIINSDDKRLANRHILLVGPPGSGKSTILKQIVRETPNHIHISMNSMIDWRLLLPVFNKLFSSLDKKILIMIDEIDELGASRDINRDDVFQLLRILDGVEHIPNINFVATTNRWKDLDNALLRTNRFGPVIPVRAPTTEQRKIIIEYYNKKYGNYLNFDEIVEIASYRKEEITGSDIRFAFEDLIINGENITKAGIKSKLDLVVDVKIYNPENIPTELYQ